VALAGVASALRITCGRMRDQKILFMGAGEAATGISDLICTAMQADGLSEQAARERLWLFDSHGLVVRKRTDLAEHKLGYAHDHAPVGDFPAAIDALRPTAIIGVAAVGGTFTEAVLRKMAEINARPIVFALSNPTSKSECTAEQAYRWTEGRGLFACGSPFDPVTLNGRTHVPRQGNNSYIFPGVGLGAIACKARHVTDEMFLAAAHALSKQVTEQDLAQGSLYPPLARVRDVSAHIAAAVAEVAYSKGLATRPRPADLLEYVRSHMYDPKYPVYL
jgi:malate dehydrogenase (oxaloacetate-decarboxylating)(NADP+)